MFFALFCEVFWIRCWPHRPHVLQEHAVLVGTQRHGQRIVHRVIPSHLILVVRFLETSRDFAKEAGAGFTTVGLGVFRIVQKVVFAVGLEVAHFVFIVSFVASSSPAAVMVTIAEAVVDGGVDGVCGQRGTEVHIPVTVMAFYLQHDVRVTVQGFSGEHVLAPPPLGGVTLEILGVGSLVEHGTSGSRGLPPRRRRRRRHVHIVVEILLWRHGTNLGVCVTERMDPAQAYVSGFCFPISPRESKHLS